MPWDPERYRSFQSERFAPFDDLFTMVRVRERLSVVDLGCGTGELTRRLADAFPGSDVLGVDSSPEMLAKAAPLGRVGLRFERTAIEEVAGSWDLVFSHAALQWVEDHERLIPRVFEMVAPGGQLAVQVPSNHNHLTHTLITETAREEPFAAALGGWTRAAPVLEIDAYAAILHRLGATDITVIEKVYGHILADADALADWTSGTALVPYFERLGDELRGAFDERYRAKLRAHFRSAPLFYPFRRTLFVASKPA
jgi:trans-aconitate 2-methyltransferase